MDTEKVRHLLGAIRREIPKQPGALSPDLVRALLSYLNTGSRLVKLVELSREGGLDHPVVLQSTRESIATLGQILTDIDQQLREELEPAGAYNQ